MIKRGSGMRALKKLGLDSKSTSAHPRSAASTQRAQTAVAPLASMQRAHVVAEPSNFTGKTRHINQWKPLSVNPCKVSFAVASYRNPNGLGQFLYCLKAQTHENWEAVIAHDGPGPESRRLVETIADPRIRFYEREHRGNHGHHHREESVRLCTGDVIGVTNEDNWYAPVYLEWMIHTMQTQDADFAYSNMIHSYSGWGVLDTVIHGGRIDCGSWLARRSVVDGLPWRDMSPGGDWTYIHDMMSRVKRTVKVQGILFVHNLATGRWSTFDLGTQFQAKDGVLPEDAMKRIPLLFHVDIAVLCQLSQRAASPGPVATALTGLFRMHADSRDHDVSYEVSQRGYWEPNITSVVGRMIGPEDVVLNIGANVGYYSLLAAARGASVVAVEPLPICLDMLRTNIVLNGFQRLIHVVDSAVWNTEGAIDLFVGDRLAVASVERSHVQQDSGPGAIAPMTVKATTVDTICRENHIVPTVILVDAECAERQVMAGAAETIEQHRPYWVMEVTPSAKPEDHAFYAWAMSRFHVHRILPSGLLMPWDLSAIVHEPHWVAVVMEPK